MERGLLDAAQGVDDLQLRVSRKTEKTKRKKKTSVSEEEDEDGQELIAGDQQGEIPDETPHEFMMRLNLYVAVHLSRASNSKRDHYKDALVYQARKDLINEFLKATLLRKCQNSGCGW
jgi:DNA-directed RNA polymerase I subunit RPA1